MRPSSLHSTPSGAHSAFIVVLALFALLISALPINAQPADSDGDGLSDDTECLIAREFVPINWFSYRHWAREDSDLHHVIAFDATPVPHSDLYVLRVTNYYKVDHGSAYFLYTFEAHPFDAEGYVFLLQGEPNHVDLMSLISMRTSSHDGDLSYDCGFPYYEDYCGSWETSDAVLVDEVIAGQRWGRVADPVAAAEHSDGLLVAEAKNGSYVHKKYLESRSVTLGDVLPISYEDGSRKWPSTWVSPIRLAGDEPLSSPVAGSVEPHALLIPKWLLSPASIVTLQNDANVPQGALDFLLDWFKSPRNEPLQDRRGLYRAYETDRLPVVDDFTLDASSEKAPVPLDQKFKDRIPVFVPDDVPLADDIPHLVTYREKQFQGTPVVRTYFWTQAITDDMTLRVMERGQGPASR